MRTSYRILSTSIANVANRPIVWPAVVCISNHHCRNYKNNRTLSQNKEKNIRKYHKDKLYMSKTQRLRSKLSANNAKVSHQINIVRAANNFFVKSAVLRFTIREKELNTN